MVEARAGAESLAKGEVLWGTGDDFFVAGLDDQLAGIAADVPVSASDEDGLSGQL